MDSKNRRTKVGARDAEDSKVFFSSAKRKAPIKEGSTEIPDYFMSLKVAKKQ